MEALIAAKMLFQLLCPAYDNADRGCNATHSVQG